MASSLPDQSNYLYFAFNTYLISQTLSGNKVCGVMARETNPQAMANNGTKLNYDIDCQGYDEQNVCDAWWYSGNYESVFTLNDFSHMSRNTAIKLPIFLRTSQQASSCSRGPWPATPRATSDCRSTSRSMQLVLTRRAFLNCASSPGI